MAGVENIIRRYISEFVTCKMCRSADTILTRDQSTRLYYMECQVLSPRLPHSVQAGLVVSANGLDPSFRW
mgnify:CR=1 FL=1